jgi:flagellar hook-basal body complex protein FliE
MIDWAIPSVAPVGSSQAVGTDTGRGVSAAGGPRTADFAAMLGGLAADASSALKNAEATSLAGIRGQASVQQVVEAVMSAEQTLQGAIAIRDKVVSAYLELSRMSI